MYKDRFHLARSTVPSVPVRLASLTRKQCQPRHSRVGPADPSPVFLNKTLLEHNHAYLVTDALWLLSGYMSEVVIKITWLAKPKVSTIQVLC